MVCASRRTEHAVPAMVVIGSSLIFLLPKVARKPTSSGTSIRNGTKASDAAAWNISSCSKS
jgi:hypothetical protein